MPQFDTRYFFSQVFWAVICFGLIWSLVHFWVMPRLRDVYAKRSALSEDLRMRAQDIEKQANDIFRNEKDRLDKARHEVMQKMDQVKRQNQKDLEDSLEKMKENYETHMKKAQDHFDQQVQGIKSRAANEAPSVAKACAGRYPIDDEKEKETR